MYKIYVCQEEKCILLDVVEEYNRLDVVEEYNRIDDTINLIYYYKDVLNICYFFNTESVA